MYNNITIIGSGWLGWPLAQHLSACGHHVIATTTSEHKVKQLNDSALRVIKLISHEQQPPAIIAALANCDIMIICIPPQRQQADYLYQLQQLLKLAQQTYIRHLLFISSTGVYGAQQGTLTESSAAAPTTESGRAMASFEQQLLGNNQKQHSVLRLAGLFGPSRHPGKFLAGKAAVSTPDAVVNMIHQSDCIGLIDAIIMQNSWGKIHLGCAPSHPQRRQFYSQGARKLGLCPPQFVAAGGQGDKLIDSQATSDVLNYQYQYPDLMAWLEQN
jgi:nucleoside-diphosphate-sugar epimerase